MSDAAQKITLDAELLAILVCPETKAKLVLFEGWLYSTHGQRRVKYPIKSGIPQLLAEEAVEVGEAEYNRIPGVLANKPEAGQP